MRTIGAALLVAAMGIPGGTALPEKGDGCTFRLTGAHPTPEIVGAPDLVARTRVMAQPDSPVAIVRVDLSGMQLTTTPGWYEKSGSYTVEVRNISTQPLVDAEVFVRAGVGAARGGSGMRARRPIAPGEQIRIEWKSGRGTGTSATDDEATVIVNVESVTTAGCVYKPSQRWPN